MGNPLGVTDKSGAEQPQEFYDDDIPGLIDEDEEIDDDNHDTIRAKWSYDGCRTLQEVIEKLELLKNYFKDLIDNGWELESPVEDDWGHIVKIS